MTEMMMLIGMDPSSHDPDTKNGIRGTLHMVWMRCQTDTMVSVVLHTFPESSRDKVIDTMVEPVKWGRHTCTPQYEPENARSTTPRVYVRFTPRALESPPRASTL